MWVAKLRIRHDDCVIGTRCQRFKVTSMGIPINKYTEDGKEFYLHYETLVGPPEKIKLFIEDLKEDPLIHDVEVQGDSIFFVNEVVPAQKVPTSLHNPKTFFVRPVVVDIEGFETWEVGSWNEQILRQFIVDLQKEHFDVKILKIGNEKLTDVYFPQVMPVLTKGQKRALDIASSNGYYDFPRKIELKDLASEAGISLSTFREHLRKAEKKIIPDLMKNIRD